MVQVRLIFNVHPTRLFPEKEVAHIFLNIAHVWVGERLIRGEKKGLGIMCDLAWPIVHREREIHKERKCTCYLNVIFTSTVFILNTRLWTSPKHFLKLSHVHQLRLFPAQDVHFFYTRSHLSALQNCALLFSTNF